MTSKNKIRGLAGNGFHPIPIGDNKNPFLKNWPEFHNPVLQKTFRTVNGKREPRYVFENFNRKLPIEPTIEFLATNSYVLENQKGIGLILGVGAAPLIYLDWDIDHPVLSEFIQKRLPIEFPDVDWDNAIRVEQTWPHFGFVFKCEADWTCGDQSVKFHDMETGDVRESKLEIKCEGRQVAIDHPNRKTSGFDPFENSVSDLAEIREGDLYEIMAWFDACARNLNLTAGSEQVCKGSPILDRGGLNETKNEEKTEALEDMIHRLDNGNRMKPNRQKIADAMDPLISAYHDMVLGSNHDHPWRLSDLKRWLSAIPENYWDDRSFWLRFTNAMKNLVHWENSYEKGIAYEVFDGISKQFLAKYDRIANDRWWNCASGLGDGDGFTMGSIVRLVQMLTGKWSCAPTVDYQPINDWIEERVDIADGTFTDIQELYKEFGTGAKLDAFINALKQKFGDRLVKKRKRIDGKQRTCYNLRLVPHVMGGIRKHCRKESLKRRLIARMNERPNPVFNNNKPKKKIDLNDLDQYNDFQLEVMIRLEELKLKRVLTSPDDPSKVCDNETETIRKQTE